MRKLLVTAIALFTVLTLNIGQSFAACPCPAAPCPICQPACPVCTPKCDPCATGFACPCESKCDCTCAPKCNCCDACENTKCKCGCYKRTFWDKLFRRYPCYNNCCPKCCD